jgi:hypothetical protein
MLGNLHVRFGVGAGVKLPGLHHISGQARARHGLARIAALLARADATLRRGAGGEGRFF